MRLGTVSGTNERKIGRTAATSSVVRRSDAAQVELLPVVGQRVAVRVGGRAGERERRLLRDGEAGPGVDGGRRVAGGGDGRAGIARARPVENATI